MSDPWDDAVKQELIGIHSSRIHKSNDTYPEYEKGQIQVPGREELNLDPDGGPKLPFAREYPVYLNKYLIGVHGEMLFHENEPHWVRNPALDSE